MKKYTIFLASSAELDEDKMLLENFVSKKNREWHQHNVFLELLTWRDFIDAVSGERTQNLYNKAIQKSDIFVVLFHTRLGRYTNEEFDVAYDQFIRSKKKKPLIFTYFKEDGSGKVEAIEAFKNRLDKMGHFYATYKNNDDLNYKFDLQLDRLARESFLKWDTFDWKKNLRYAFLVLIPVILLVFVYNYLQLRKPIDLTVTVKETLAIPNMPFERGNLTLVYEEKAESEFITGNHETFFKEIPATYKGEEANLRFEANGYESVDTTIKLKDRGIILPIKRDNSLGMILGRVKDHESNQPLPGVTIQLKDLSVVTDSLGRFTLNIPFEKQQKEQRVIAIKSGYLTWDYTFPVSDKQEVVIHLEKDD